MLISVLSFGSDSLRGKLDPSLPPPRPSRGPGAPLSFTTPLGLGGHLAGLGPFVSII